MPEPIRYWTQVGTRKRIVVDGVPLEIRIEQINRADQIRVAVKRLERPRGLRIIDRDGKSSL